MADSDPPTPKPPPPPKAAAKHKTSTVPLKKETVRITLKARPQGDDETATAPTATAPTAPAAGGVSDDTVTAPVAAAPGPPRAPAVRPAGAKTIPLAKAPAARPAGAKTIPLAKAPAAGRPTQPLAGGPVTGARPLPKATVQLQKSQPLGGGQPPTAALQKAGAPMGAVAAVTESIDEDDAEANIMPFAILVLILALVVLGIEVWTVLEKP
jgi:hypothetical protein